MPHPSSAHQERSSHVISERLPERDAPGSLQEEEAGTHESDGVVKATQAAKQVEEQEDAEEAQEEQPDEEEEDEEEPKLEIKVSPTNLLHPLE